MKLLSRQLFLLFAQTLLSEEVLPPTANSPVNATVQAEVSFDASAGALEAKETPNPSLLPTPFQVATTTAPTPTSILPPGTQQDCAIIRQLYDSTGGPDWIDQGLQYINGDCCKWTGKIDCNSDGKVVNM